MFITWEQEMENIGTLTGATSISQWYDDEKKKIQWTIGDIMEKDGWEFTVNNLTADTQKELLDLIINAKRSSGVDTPNSHGI